MLKVCLLVGSNESRFCGVKDYSQQLATALSGVGVNAEVLAASSWSLGGFAKLRKSIKSSQFDIAHIQYPSIGFGTSLLPHCMGLSGTTKRTLLTLHDYSALPRPQRMSTYLFRWTTDQIVFVSEFERDAYWGKTTSSEKSLVIPIGSSIPAYPNLIEREPIVLYFGQIRPGKGIEDFLALAELCSTESLPFRFVIAGSSPEKHSDYYSTLRSQTRSLIEWKTDLASPEISRLLAASFAAYLPFPDGASERRSSMMAALTNGVPVISRVGPATGRLATVLLSADSPEEAIQHLISLRRNADWANSIRRQSRLFARHFEWPQIAQEHKRLYESVMQSSSEDRQTVSSKSDIAPVRLSSYGRDYLK